MNDEQWTDLGRRAMACKGWHWMRGMSTICGLVAQSNEDATGRVYFGQWVEPHPDWLPDLRDPATLGCLLALVRKAWGTAHARQANRINGSRAWECACNDGDGWSYFSEPTEAAALVAALESAP